MYINIYIYIFLNRHGTAIRNLSHRCEVSQRLNYPSSGSKFLVFLEKSLMTLEIEIIFASKKLC